MSLAAALTAGNEMREEGNVDQILKEYEKTYSHQQLKDGDYPASLDTTKKEVHPFHVWRDGSSLSTVLLFAGLSIR